VAVVVWGQQHRRENSVFSEEFGPDQTFAVLLQQHLRQPFRIAVVDWHPTRAQLAGLETFGGASPVFSGRFRDYAFRAAAPQLSDPRIKLGLHPYWYHILMSGWGETTLTRAFNPTPHTAASWNLRVLAAANVRYLLSANEIPGLSPAPDMPLGTGIRVYEVPEAFPRAYMVAQLKTRSNGDALLDDLAGSTMAELRSTLWADQMPLVTVDRGSGRSACGTVEIESYAPDRIRLAVQARSPCYLVLLNNYDKRWSATIDGDTAPVFRANHAFQALAIGRAGRRLVEFRYQDDRFPLIFLLIPLGALVIGIAPWAGMLQRRRRPTSMARSAP
jgi:hypothetical protein